MSTSRSNILIVEGTDDRYFINQILVANGYQKSTLASGTEFIVERAADGTAIRIVQANGFDNIPLALKAEFQPDSLGALAIVADMDRHEDSRWLSLKGMLAKYQYANLPVLLPYDGLVESPPEIPALGIWLMPDNSAEGMAESFAASLIPDGDKGWSHARLTVGDLPAAAKRFIERYRDKALLHTWLAWQEEPGCQTGAAVLKKLLDVNRPLALNFVAWIERWLAAGATRPTAT